VNEPRVVAASRFVPLLLLLHPLGHPLSPLLQVGSINSSK
jgi:hypothetical protein